MCGKDVQKRNFLSLKTEKKVKEITLSIIDVILSSSHCRPSLTNQTDQNIGRI